MRLVTENFLTHTGSSFSVAYNIVIWYNGATRRKHVVLRRNTEKDAFGLVTRGIFFRILKSPGIHRGLGASSTDGQSSRQPIRTICRVCGASRRYKLQLNYSQYPRRKKKACDDTSLWARTNPWLEVRGRYHYIILLQG